MSLDKQEITLSMRSIRRYKPIDISYDMLEKILKASVYAPFGSGLLAYYFIVVKNPQKKKDIVKTALNQKWMLQAPIFIVICADRIKSLWKGKDYSIIDASLAAQNLMLSAYKLGLGTCFVGAFYEDDVKNILAIPNHVTPLGIITLGYPDEKPRLYKRDAKDITFFEKFGKKDIRDKLRNS